MIELYSAYNLLTGRITKHITSDGFPEMPPGFDDEEGLIEGYHNPISRYVDTEAVVVIERPDNPSVANKTDMLADGVDIVEITNVPAGSSVSIDGQGAWQVDDGAFEFSTDTAGTYKVTVDSFPDKKKEFTINAS